MFALCYGVGLIMAINTDSYTETVLSGPWCVPSRTLDSVMVAMVAMAVSS